jgi:hypothetical protein
VDNIRSEKEFDKFYKESELWKWTPDDGVLSRKTVLWTVWNAAWQRGDKEGREYLAATLQVQLNKLMGKKSVTSF